MTGEERTEGKAPPRRHFLRRLLGGMAALAATSRWAWLRPRRPEERLAREADFYRPHDLAG